METVEHPLASLYTTRGDSMPIVAEPMSLPSRGGAVDLLTSLDSQTQRFYQDMNFLKYPLDELPPPGKATCFGSEEEYGKLCDLLFERHMIDFGLIKVRNNRKEEEKPLP